MTRESWNGCRYTRKPSPMYESYFLRGNHPTEPHAFWIRYTIYHGRNGESAPEAELWLALFHEGRAVAGGHKTFPLSQSTWASEGLDVRISETVFLKPAIAKGALELDGKTFHWDLTWEGAEAPMLMLSEALYRGGFPKAKAVVPAPMVRFSGQIKSDDLQWNLEDWLGSQNHNWGSRHTDAYAWGQVMGFDNHPEASLECATARLRLGGVLWTPPLSVACVRVDGEEYRFDSLVRAMRSSGEFSPGDWSCSLSNGRERLEIKMKCSPESIVSLPYRNPPGGLKTCLNTKVAHAEAILRLADGEEIRLHTQNRAAFEILKD